ncbi:MULTISPECIES: hypothetical protein [Acidianus]|uniref:hypothetical protein n=1 Tax=Acidianus TaxID=12914 RepID=UPI0006936284|nr:MULTISPECIES: hypothetical protein [Acidianus]NON63202.1 hypothetical protein [Acidianus sp. RZ1]
MKIYVLKDRIDNSTSSNDVVIVLDGLIVKMFIEGKEVKISPSEAKNKNMPERIQKILEYSVADSSEFQIFSILRDLGYPLNGLIGMSFEEYIYDILKAKYKVKRGAEIFQTVSRFTGKRTHNKPDFIVEDKIVVEAKVGSYNFSQIKEYSRLFEKGIIVFPYTSQCKVPPHWICLFNTLIDRKRIYSYVDRLLLK